MTTITLVDASEKDENLTLTNSGVLSASQRILKSYSRKTSVASNGVRPIQLKSEVKIKPVFASKLSESRSSLNNS